MIEMTFINNDIKFNTRIYTTIESLVQVFQCVLYNQRISTRKFLHYVLHAKVLVSVFDEMNAVQATTISILGLHLHSAELVLGSVDDQYVSEAWMIRFRRSSKRIEKFGWSIEWEMKRHHHHHFQTNRKIRVVH